MQSSVFLSFLSCTGVGNLLTGRSSCCETDREIVWSYRRRGPRWCRGEIQTCPRLKSLYKGGFTHPGCVRLCVRVCLCIPSRSVCVISRGLEALSSALISPTDVTPAWPRPRQSRRGATAERFFFCFCFFFSCDFWKFLSDFFSFVSDCLTEIVLNTDRGPSRRPWLSAEGDKLDWEITEMKLIWMKSLFLNRAFWKTQSQSYFHILPQPLIFQVAPFTPWFKRVDPHTSSPVNISETPFHQLWWFLLQTWCCHSAVCVMERNTWTLVYNFTLSVETSNKKRSRLHNQATSGAM